jgi:mannan endo-1,4-beta-mannosidase
MFTRRNVLLSGTALLAACATGTGTGGGGRRDFVRREGTRFELGGRPYRYVGTNMWYAAYLGANAPYGNRDRLRRELDAVAALGMKNIRILGSSELSPLKNSITPAFRTETAEYSRTLLEGLDYALAEMGRRGLTAIIYLTNFWEWSGGMMTYLYWNNGGRFINMNDPAHPWPAFADMTAQFYTNERAVGMYHDYVRTLVGRTNSITGTRYADDPAIMSWQLANEPRPGGGEEVGHRQLPAYMAWIRNTGRLIKSIDPNHLVSTGSEGLQGCLGRESCVVSAHEPPEIDYLTAHIWPQNWGWADPKNLPGTFEGAAEKTRDYIQKHVALAERLGKPLVIEEFGFPRDEGSFDPKASTSFKDRYYAVIFDAVLDSVRRGGPIAGSNFWAWGGEGRAQHPDFAFRPGDVTYLGDPPHEPQGWYSVLATDRSTQELIRSHAAALEGVTG